MKFFAIFLLLSTAAFASKAHQLETAIVVSQEVSAGQRGYAVMPMGTGIVGAPIMRRSDVVVVETDHQRITWVEVGRRTIILPVNGKIDFYRDGNWFIVRDAKGKKHKFAMVHLEHIDQPR